MHRLMNFGLGILVFLVTASQINANESGHDLADVWEQDWENRANKIVDSLVIRLQEPLRESLDSRSLEAVAKELREVFHSAVSWEAFSGTVIEAIATNCDAETLQRIAPYLSQSENSSEADEGLKRDFSLCYSDAMFRAESAAAYALMEKASVAGSVFSKYETVARSYRRISPVVTTASVEEKYGGVLDDVVSVHTVLDLEARQLRATALTSLLDNQTAILSVSLEDPGYTYTVFNQVFSYQRDGSRASGLSCYGASPPEQEGLIRCSGDDGARVEDDVISYTRHFDFDGERLEIIVTFDYDELLKAFAD